MLLLAAVAPSSTAQSKQGGELDVGYSIDLDASSVNVDVSAEGGGVVFISGNVTLTRSADVAVHLGSFMVSNSWESTVEPDTLYFTKSGTAKKAFAVTLLVPHGVPKDVSDILKVNGTWDKLGIDGNIPPDQCVVNIKQFSELEVLASDSDQPYKEFGEIDSTLEFPVVFHNTGNGDDIFELLCTGFDSIGDLGLGGSVELQRGEEKPRTMRIDLPDNDDMIEYVLAVTASSRRTTYTSTTEVHIYIQEGRAFVVLSPDPILIVRRGLEFTTANIDGFKDGGEREITITVAAYIAPVEDITLILDCDDGFAIENPPEPFTLYPGQRETFELRVTYEQTNVSLRELPNRLLVLHAQGKNSNNGGLVNSNKLRLITAVSLPGKNTKSLMDSPYVAPVAGATAAAVVGLVGFATYASSETGKYKLLGLLFVPLYTKLHKDKVLDHFARGRLYEYIKLNPGVTFTALKSELDLGNGTLTYHLSTLEREELIKSKKEGRNRCFYVTGAKVQTPGIKDDILGALKGVDRKIYSMIKDKPGISQMEIFRVLKMETNLAQRTVSNHIKMMERRGLIRMKRDGKDKRCYLVEGATAA